MLVLYNGPNQSTAARAGTPLNASGEGARVIGAGSLASAQAGDRVIIGNPRGALLADVFVELRDPNGRLVDVVEIGGNTGLTDRGGDGIMNGAPEAGSNGDSSSLANETV